MSRKMLIGLLGWIKMSQAGHHFFSVKSNMVKTALSKVTTCIRRLVPQNCLQ
jgi:hypothetical protein